MVHGGVAPLEGVVGKPGGLERARGADRIGRKSPTLRRAPAPRPAEGRRRERRSLIGRVPAGLERARALPLPDETRSLGFPPHHSSCRSPTSRRKSAHGCARQAADRVGASVQDVREAEASPPFGTIATLSGFLRCRLRDNDQASKGGDGQTTKKEAPSQLP